MSESQLLFSKCNLGELLTSSASGGEWTLSKVLPPETKGRRKCKSALPWRGLTSLIFHQELVAAVGRGCSAEGEGGGADSDLLILKLLTRSTLALETIFYKYSLLMGFFRIPQLGIRIPHEGLGIYFLAKQWFITSVGIFYLYIK